MQWRIAFLTVLINIDACLNQYFSLLTIALDSNTMKRIVTK